MVNTFVTAFVNIRDWEKNQRRDLYGSLDLYKQHAERILRLDIPLVLYIDPCLEEWVLERREHYGHLAKTNVIVTRVEDLPLFERYEEAKVLHKNGGVPHNQNPEKFTPLYYLTIWCKTYFVADAIKRNVFGHDRFCWIDFRLLSFFPENQKPTPIGGNPQEIFPEVINRSTDPIHFTLMNHAKPGQIYDRKAFYSYEQGKVSAQMFLGTTEELISFHDFCKEEIEKCLTDYKILTSEQNIYAAYFVKRSTRDPETIGFHICDYFEVLGHLQGNYSDQWNTWDLCVQSAKSGSSPHNKVMYGRYLKWALDTLEGGYWRDLASQRKYIDLLNRIYLIVYYDFPEMLPQIERLYLNMINFNVNLVRKHEGFIRQNIVYLSKHVEEKIIHYLDTFI